MMQRSCLFFAALLWLQARAAGKAMPHPQYTFLLALVTDFLLSRSKDRRALKPYAAKTPEQKQLALLAIDLDGTLLNGKSVVTERTKQALKKFVEATHGFIVFATGQPPRAARRVQDQLADLDLNAYFIVSGGALCLHGPSWEVRKEYAIPQSCVENVLNAVLYEIPEFYISIETRSHWLVSDESYFELVNTTMPGMGTKLKKLATVVGREGICSVLQTPEFASNALRIILLHDAISAEESMQRIAPLLEKVVGVSLEVKHAGVPTGVEILPKNVGKATAVEEVCKQLDVPAEGVVAFGDQMNDLQLLQWAGLGIAMKNGDAKLITACDVVTEKANDEDGVAVEIERIVESIGNEAAIAENGIRLRKVKQKLETENRSFVKKIDYVHTTLLSAIECTTLP